MIGNEVIYDPNTKLICYSSRWFDMIEFICCHCFESVDVLE